MSEWTRRYEYAPSSVETYVPQSGGVYRLIYNSGDRYYVFYAGQSENLRRRLGEHLSQSEPDACIKKYLSTYRCYFRYIRLDTQTERDKMETQQIREYNPTCNS